VVRVSVGHRPPVGVRAGTLGGPRGAAEAAAVELVLADGRQRGRPQPAGRVAPGERAPAGAILHRALPMPSRQHLRLPRKSISLASPFPRKSISLASPFLFSGCAFSERVAVARLQAGRRSHCRDTNYVLTAQII